MNKLFITPEKIISFETVQSFADPELLVVSERSKYVNGKEVKITHRWTLEKLEQMYKKYENSNSGSISRLLEVWQKDPNNLWKYCGCPYDKL